MLSRKKILVVEDNEINRAMLGNILAQEYDILEAGNGQEGLEILREQGEGISLILLDIVMPVMDGYTFLSLVKEDPVCSAIPVIVTMQSDGESDEVRALSHGAADFVAKPYKPQIILHRVASIINLRETAAMFSQIKYDRLTGLYSKEFFYQKVREVLVRNPDQAYDIICSDVENFKLINDVFGVAAGDKLLQGIAGLYQGMVGEGGICGRFNADQFACLVEHKENYTDEGFIEAGIQVNALSNVKNIAMKWGIYEVTDRSLSVEQMCDRALLAAASIKRQYGKYFARYDDTLRSRLLREQDITDSMETALAEKQFVIFLQPKYSIQDESLAGAEALVRWEHPEWGLQSPGIFIPLFERNGFITRLDQYVWEKTCDILEKWDQKGYPPIPVSVNVSRADIYNADLPDILMKTVRRHGLSPSRLHLEITESAYTEDPEQIIETVRFLRDLGFVIEMDDFGSGYSSLNMINEMPIDVLKLDMKFIQNETAKPINQGILRFIISLARWMSLSVVAEGVEIREQLDRLREVGCDYVQGYYFAKPMPEEQFEELLAKGSPRQKNRRAVWQYPEGLRRQILLVADEDAAYRASFREAFEERYEIEEAADGATALTKLQQYENHIAAVILSITLTGLEREQIMETIQREKNVWNIPVIVTGPADEQLEEDALGKGADDYACKPHQQSSLQKRLRHVLDAAALRERERVLQDEAYRDYLTGLLNRRGFNASVRAVRREDGPLAVYMFDLDELKLYNDTYGHPEGDQLIVSFASLLRAQTRGDDILARIGGDEFVVVMKQMGSEELALKKGNDICEKIRGSVLTDGGCLACSGGIAFWDDGLSLEEAMERADQALYCAKQENKSRCCLWRKE